MQRDGGVHPSIPVRGPHRPLRRVQIVGDRHHRRHPDGLGAVQDRGHVGGVDGTARIQMGVGVDEQAQRFGRGRWGPFGAHHETIEL